MKKRFICYKYEDYKRDWYSINTFKYHQISRRLSDDEFNNLLFTGDTERKNPSMECEGITPHKIFEVKDIEEIDRAELNVYLASSGIEGDIVVIDEAIKPDNMTEEEFSNLSFEELYEKICDGDIEEQSDSVLTGYVPVEISEDIHFEFKPDHKIRLKFVIELDNWKELADAESNIAHSEVFWYNQYREDINYTFTDDFFNDYDTLADIKDSKEEYLDYAVEGFVDNLENDFDISSNFILTDEMKEEYERIVRNDLEEAFNRYIEEKEEAGEQNNEQ